MIPPTESLVEALRDELKQHGEMLALLETQHQTASAGAPGVPAPIAAIAAQCAAMAAARSRRLECQRALGSSSSDSLSKLIATLPGEYRPLLEALARDNEESLARVLERIGENHRLFCRLAEQLQCLIHTLSGLADDPSPATHETSAPKSSDPPDQAAIA